MPKRFVALLNGKYVERLAHGSFDNKVTDALTKRILDRLDSMNIVYEGLQFMQRSLVIPIYQSIVLLEDMGCTIAGQDCGKLTSWMAAVYQEAKHATFTPNYAKPIQQILRESAQEQFWATHRKTVMGLFSISTEASIKQPVLIG